jgi:hypothetical protein
MLRFMLNLTKMFAVKHSGAMRLEILQGFLLWQA